MSKKRDSEKNAAFLLRERRVVRAKRMFSSFSLIL